jgi:hypothetical protein
LLAFYPSDDHLAVQGFAEAQAVPDADGDRSEFRIVVFYHLIWLPPGSWILEVKPDPMEGMHPTPFIGLGGSFQAQVAPQADQLISWYICSRLQEGPTAIFGIPHAERSCRQVLTDLAKLLSRLHHRFLVHNPFMQHGQCPTAMRFRYHRQGAIA